MAETLGLSVMLRIKYCAAVTGSDFCDLHENTGSPGRNRSRVSRLQRSISLTWLPTAPLPPPHQAKIGLDGDPGATRWANLCSRLRRWLDVLPSLLCTLSTVQVTRAL